MRCCHCNKNEAVKSYERTERGVTERQYYCLSCYESLFLCVQEAVKEPSLSACPYCGTTLEEFQTEKLLGCAYCYKTMHANILPSVIGMQGEIYGHKGKQPPLSEEVEALLIRENFFTEEAWKSARAEYVQKERFQRQKREMETLIAYLGAIHSPREQEYREKLERMMKTGAVEEEIVW